MEDKESAVAPPKTNDVMLVQGCWGPLHRIASHRRSRVQKAEEEDLLFRPSHHVGNLTVIDCASIFLGCSNFLMSDT